MTGTDPKSAYLQATQRLMQQLAAGGLRMGLSHGQMETSLRDAMLEAAYTQSLQAGARVTVSALHVATGIHRREVSRWLAQRQDVETAARPRRRETGSATVIETAKAGADTPADEDADAGAGAGAGDGASASASASEIASAQTLGNDSPSARVVARWITNAAYTDEQGQPLTLPMAKQAEAVSFAQLVEDIGPEVRARSVLDGLIAAGLPEANSTESIGFLAANVGDHLAAAIHNISAPADARFFERAFFDDAVSAATVQALQEKVQDEGMALLRGMVGVSDLVDRSDAETGTVLGDAGKQRVRIGLYCYAENLDG